MDIVCAIHCRLGVHIDDVNKNISSKGLSSTALEAYPGLSSRSRVSRPRCRPGPGFSHLAALAQPALVVACLLALLPGGRVFGALTLRCCKFSLVLSLCVVAPSLVADDRDDDIVMVAHPAVAVDYLQRNVARAIFGMRQRTWPGGMAVRVFVLPDSHPVHARFVKERLEVLPHQLQLSWDRVVFSGTGQAPERVSTVSSMLEQVAVTPGGIGYMERGAVDERVRIITLEP